MKKWFQRQFDYANGNSRSQVNDDSPGFDTVDLLEGFSGGWQWDELAAEVSQESQACMAIAGLPGSGKSLLFNRLRGWAVSETGHRSTFPAEPGSDAAALQIESFGAFQLVDLPQHSDEILTDGDALWLAIGSPALVVYLFDGVAGVRQIDYRWISLLRTGGKPVLVVLNQSDLIGDVMAAVTEAQLRLGTKVIPISALNGDNVESALLPAILDAAPRIAVPLGREIRQLRRQASQRVIRSAALYTGLLSAQPVPLVDIPFQIMAQVGAVMRVGAAYGCPPTGGISRELIGVIASSLALNYLTQTIAKFVPVLGWAVSGILGATATWMIGESAIFYYEGGVERAGQFATDRLQLLSNRRAKLAQKIGGLSHSRLGKRES